MIPFAALDAAVALLKRYKVLILVLPLLMALGVQSCRLKSAKADLLEKQAIISNMKLASEQARAAQIALNNENADLSERIANNAALRHMEIANATGTAVRDYINRNRLRSDCYRSASGTDQAAVLGGAETPDRTDANADMVAVSASDLEAISKAAVRGREAQAFLIEQVNEGLAVQN
jgi:hypothetical protein